MSINPLAEVWGQMEGGQLRAVAVTSAQPSRTCPTLQPSPASLLSPATTLVLSCVD